MKLFLVVIGCLIAVATFVWLSRKEVWPPWEKLPPLRLESGVVLVTQELDFADKKMVSIAMEEAQKNRSDFDPANLSHVKISKLSINQVYVYLHTSPAVILRGQRFSTAVEVAINITSENKDADPQITAHLTGWSDERAVSATYPIDAEFYQSTSNKPFPLFKPTEETGRILNLLDKILKNDTVSAKHATLSAGLMQLNARYRIYILQSDCQSPDSTDEPQVFHINATLYENDNEQLLATIDVLKNVVVESRSVMTPPLLI